MWRNSRHGTTSSFSTTRTPAAPICPTSRSSPGRSSALPSRERTTPTSAGASRGACRPSRALAEEGVVIPPTRLDDAVVDDLVSRMRNPEERRGDLRAQLAAHGLAERRLTELCVRRGRERIAAAMDELFGHSERAVRAALARLPDGRFDATDVLETRAGDLELRVVVTWPKTRSPSTSGAPQPSTRGTSTAHSPSPSRPATSSSAASPTRTCPRPARSLRDRPGPARLAGQRAAAGRSRRRQRGDSCRIVDVCFRALGQALPVTAQGQGTMNNVTLGNDRFTYYETIGGGQGACDRLTAPRACT